jgi:nicotinamidase-related amidase
MIIIHGKEVLMTIEELAQPQHTALLLIDVQNDFVLPGGGMDKAGTDISMLKEVPCRIKPVLEAARRCGIMVVHIQHTVYPGRRAESPAWLHFLIKRRKLKLSGSESADRSVVSHVMEGTWGWQESDVVAPEPGEIIVKKHRSSAFVGTDLDMILRSNGIKTVVGVGVVTEGCVLSTMRDSQFFEYYAILLRDCVATTSREIHEAALLVESTRMEVVDSSEVLEVWNKQPALAQTER